MRPPSGIGSANDLRLIITEVYSIHTEQEKSIRAPTR